MQMRHKLMFVLAMVIFGTTGLFVRQIPIPSSEIALIRGIIGSLFLMGVIGVSKRPLAWEAIRRNLLLLVVSGGVLGFNWILLFQAYRYTTLSNAVLSYYFAPVFVMLLSPFVLKEKLSVKKILCIAGAMAGMLMIMGNNGESTAVYDHGTGIAFGLGAAAFYAALMLLSKFIRDLSGLEITLVQLISSSCVLFLYVLLTEDLVMPSLPGMSGFWLLFLGVVHTGFGFFLFFSAMQHMKGQTIAALSYSDPFTTVTVSALVLHESMTTLQLLGGVLLLGATFLGGRLPESE